MLHHYKRWLFVKNSYDDDDIRYDNDQNPGGCGSIDSSDDSEDSNDAGDTSDDESE